MELNRELYIKGVSDYLENGKNLLKLTDGTYENNGITVVVSNGIITINGTATNTSFISIPYAFANLTLYSGKTYTLSCNNTTIASGGLSVRPIGDLGTFQADLGRTNSTSTTTISSNQTGTYLLIRSNSGVVANNVVVKPQLEEGPIATNFELYNGGYASKDYLEDGKQLFNKNTTIDGYGIVKSSGAITAENTQCYSDFIPAKPNTSYAFNINFSSNNFGVTFYNSSKTYLSGLSYNEIGNGKTFTTPANTAYIIMTIKIANKDTFMLNKGTSVLPYEEYYGKYLNKGDGILIPYTLYENSSGTNGNITISENFSNYKEFDVYVANQYGSRRKIERLFYSSDTSKNYTILTYGASANASMSLSATTFNLSGNTLSILNSVTATLKTPPEYNTTNTNYIQKIVGYK